MHDKISHENINSALPPRTYMRAQNDNETLQNTISNAFKIEEQQVLTMIGLDTTSYKFYG